MNDNTPAKSNVVALPKMKGAPKADRVKITHIRDERGHIIATVAVRPSAFVNMGYGVGVSILNPKDRFNRSMGLKIAEGRAARAATSPTREGTDYTLHTDSPFVYDVLMTALQRAEDGKLNLPRRVVRAMNMRIDQIVVAGAAYNEAG